MDCYDKIYYSLIGELNEGEAREGIPNAFAPGSECDCAYTRLIEARNRVVEKMGTDDDPDLSQMLTQMNTIQRALCRQLRTLDG